MSPIRPEMRALYPANWKDIRQRILERSGNKCEWCGAPNHEEGCHTKDGKWHSGRDIAEGSLYMYDEDPHPVRIVLTIAHLDHNPENCSDDNLRALCQKDHNAYDMPERARGRKKRLEAKLGVKYLWQGL